MTTQNPVAAPAAAPRPYKILIAYAFEPTADVALQIGLNLAAGNPAAELHVVHAVAVPAALASEALPETVDRLEQARLLLRERVEAAWRQHGGKQIIAHVRPGDPDAVVIQAAIDIDADLLVVGSHRHSGIRKLVLGSVAERLCHNAHCPVLLAVPKDFGGTATPTIEAPCPDCLSTRKQSANARFWCERHSRPYLEPHIYVPRDQARSSVFPTY
jgi:nucleotide-binding universal stress UspA family protein